MRIRFAPIQANEKQRKPCRQCRIDALMEAMQIALQTGDGKTAAAAIQQQITTLQLQQERKGNKH